MKLQKLVYYAHGWHLGYGRGTLCSELVEAWPWGPVFPKLYHAVKRWGRGPIDEERIGLWRLVDDEYRRETPITPDDGSYAPFLISAIWDIYSSYDDLQLSAKTHEPGSPWAEVWNDSGPYAVIPNFLIERYFQAQIDARRESDAAIANS